MLAWVLAGASPPPAASAPPAEPGAVVAPDSLAPDAPPRSFAEFPPARRRAWQVGLARPDRLEHAGLSFTLATMLMVATRDRRVAAGATLALGTAKELWDARGSSGFDSIDLAADASGVAVALLCVRARAH